MRGSTILNVALVVVAATACSSTQEPLSWYYEQSIDPHSWNVELAADSSGRFFDIFNGLGCHRDRGDSLYKDRVVVTDGSGEIIGSVSIPQVGTVQGLDDGASPDPVTKGHIQSIADDLQESGSARCEITMLIPLSRSADFYVFQFEKADFQTTRSHTELVEDGLLKTR